MAHPHHLHGLLNHPALRPGSLLLTVPQLATLPARNRRQDIKLRLLHHLVRRQRGVLMGIFHCVPDVRHQAHLCVRGFGRGKGRRCVEDAVRLRKDNAWILMLFACVIFCCLAGLYN
jgi:hypothetical protein